jgi:2-methylcitrate dehydratase PrpD
MDVPVDARAVAVACLVDIIGVAVAGTGRPVSKTAADFATAMYGAGNATILANRQCAHPQAAAFANGVAAHALDYDDTSYAGILHASAVVFPATLASAEALRLPGADFLSAFIAGVETIYSLGKLLGRSAYDRGWFTTGVLGNIGAAVATSSVLASDVEQLVRSIALAGAGAGGPRVILGSDTKPWAVGRAALAGYECGHAASQKLSVPEDVCEGQNGLFQILTGERQPPGELGDSFGLLDPGIFFKRFPVCSSAQAALTALERLMMQTPFGHADVEGLVVELAPLAYGCLPYTDPKDSVQAQFSAQFALACLLVFGKLDAAILGAYTRSEQRLAETMAKISTRRGLAGVDTERYPEAARVTLSLKDGARVTETVTAANGHPENPMSPAQLADKFRANLTGYPPERVEALLEAIRQIHALPRVSELLAALRLDA